MQRNWRRRMQLSVIPLSCGVGTHGVEDWCLSQIRIPDTGRSTARDLNLDSFVTFALRGPSGMVLPRLVTDTWGAL